MTMSQGTLCFCAKVKDALLQKLIKAFGHCENQDMTTDTHQTD